jgi:small conductance mechanosensitive channel
MGFETIDLAKLKEVALYHGSKILLILIIAFVALRFVKYLTRKIQGLVDDGDPHTLTAKEQRAQTLSSVVNNTALILVFLVAGMMIMQEFGFEIGPIIAGAGIAGLAIGFGAQNLVKDVIGGFFILMENQFGVGDVISVAGVSGLVEKMNLRVTILRDIEGVVHIIPNGEITVVSNMTKEWSRALVKVGVAYGEDIDRVMEVLKDISLKIAGDDEFSSLIIEEPVVQGIEGLDESAVTVRVLAKTLPLKQWDVMRELRRRIKQRFDEEGIEIPFPQRTMWLRGEKTSNEIDVD